MLYSELQKRFSLTQVYGTKDKNGTNRVLSLTNGVGIGDDPNVPVNLQLSQPQQQHYKAPSGTTKLGYDFDHLASIPLIMIKNYWPQNVLIASADYNCIDAFPGDQCFSPANKKNELWF